MPIREPSFRMGCGRYLQGENIVEKCGEEVLRLGSAPIIVGGPTALSIAKDAVVSSVSAVCKKYEVIEHSGTCNDERAIEIAKYANENGYDVIIGVGGGVIMDFAKLCAHFAGCPVINVPTSSATCAAYTPLSVRYTPEGKTVGTMHFTKEVDAVLADTAILKNQPIRLLLAGGFDALAKFIEIKQRFDINASVKSFPMGLDYAYVLAKHSYDVLNREIDGCIEDMKAGLATERVEQVIFTAIAATGVISGISRGSNQCALAHKFYETTRTLFHESARPYLHGEIVGVGLILQNLFNGEAENNKPFIALMKKHGMPYRITDITITPTLETMAEYEIRLKNTSAIDETNADECFKLHDCLTALWRAAKE